MMRRLVLIVLLLMPTLSHAAEKQVLEVISLGYRQADDVIPMLRPLLAPGGTITGTKNQLVVRTTRANMAELKQVLAAVDSAPPRSSGRPSRQTWSLALARSPSVATRPLIVTRPSRIHSSMPRREPCPAPASSFCNRSLIRTAA